MQARRRLMWVTVAGVLVVAPAWLGAQSDVHVQSADLSVRFGVQEGSVVLVGEELVFVDADDPASSFAITRSNVRDVESDDDVVTITVRRPVAGGQRELSLRLGEPEAVVSWYGAPRATSAPAADAGDREAGEVVASYQAQHDHRLGNCLGQLIITEDRLSFESVSEIDDSRQWAFADIREIRQDGIYRLSITPFIGNSYNLELVGRGMDSAQFRNLVDKITAARAR